jgi:hypothetical protein
LSIVPRPRGVHLIQGKWVFNVTRDEYGCIERREARFVAKGFAQKLYVHYDATWAPTAHYATLRFLFSLAVQLDLMIRHIDVERAFLNGALEEEIYIEQPAVLNDGNNDNVWLLHKALYGLKQAGCLWHLHLHDVLISLQFTLAGYDPALFISSATNTFVLLWVEDLFVFGSSEACEQFTTSIMGKFESRDLEEAKSLLAWLSLVKSTKEHFSLSHEQMFIKMLRSMVLKNVTHPLSLWLQIKLLSQILAENPARLFRLNSANQIQSQANVKGFRQNWINFRVTRNYYATLISNDTCR